MRDSITHRLGHSAVFSAGCGPLVPQVLLPPGDKAQTAEVDLNSVFLPEFPHRTFPEGERQKVPRPRRVRRKREVTLTNCISSVRSWAS